MSASIQTGMNRSRQTGGGIAHVAAGGLALLYAYAISGTGYVTTGLQFVSPLAVVLFVHLIWTGVTRGFVPGFAVHLFGRALVTSLGIAGCTAGAAVFAPAPVAAESSAGQIIGVIVSVIACLAVLAAVVAAMAAIVYAAGLVLWYIFVALRNWFGRPPGRGDSRLFDMGALAIAALSIGACSLDGIVPLLSFAPQGSISSTVTIAVPPDRVWQTMGTATSPDFPLPVMLKSIPQPVAVLVDEGVSLGARRVVHFRGREGAGDLSLQVSRRTEQEAVFTAVSDTSPIAMWVKQTSLIFKVEPTGKGSRLTVTSRYERLLSPAWFFKPYIGFATYLAVNVLARDTKIRAEAG